MKTSRASMTSRTKKSRLSKSHCKKETEVDRISDLPGNVIDQILSYLSIRESAKTSLLSTKWRHKWESVPSLVFDDQSFSVDTVEELVTEIDRVLMLHVGPIHKFELSITLNLPFEEIDKWILYVSRRSIKELVLYIPEPEYYQTPARLFSCQSLEHLEISYCELTPPSKFKGFKNLKSLDIGDLAVDQNALENLISGSTLLENLALTDLDGVDHLNINAPNLRSLVFSGPLLRVSLKNTPLLSVLSMTATTGLDVNDREGHFGGDSSFFNLMSNIPQLGSLTIAEYYFAFLAGGDIPKELPIQCVNLVYLSIDLNFTSFNETSALLCLLRSSPNLKEVHLGYCVDDSDEIISSIWDANDLNFQLSSLQLVKMGHFCGTQVENDLIKFMLLVAPDLKSMIVELEPDSNCWDSSGDDAKSEMLKKLLRFKRASVEAEIIFLEP